MEVGVGAEDSAGIGAEDSAGVEENPTDEVEIEEAVLKRQQILPGSTEEV